MRGIVGDGGVVGLDPPHVTARRALPLLPHPLLDGDLDRIVKLLAPARQELDAVVGHRIVTGREHDTQVDAETVGQVGNPRGWQYAESNHVHAGRSQPGNHRSLQELSRDSGVTADHGPRSVTRELAAVGQDMGCCNGKVQGQLRRQCGVCQTPDPVRAEESRHEGRL